MAETPEEGTAAPANPLSCTGCGKSLSGRQRKWCSSTCQQAGTRATLLSSRFNLTTAEYDQILQEQGGLCAVCNKPPTGNRRFAVDHDHKTGYVRGILCGFCNLRFVSKHRDPELFRRAYEYLQHPPARRALGRDVIAPGRPRQKRRRRRKVASK